MSEQDICNASYEQLKKMDVRNSRQMAPVLGYLVVMVISGFIGNTITCFVFRFRMKKTTGNTLILWLAVINLFNCITDMPYKIYALRFENSFTIPTLCKMMHYFLYATMFASACILLMIAVDKFYKICRPLRIFPVKKTRTLVGISMISGLVLAVPASFLYGPMNRKLPDGRDCNIGCSLDDKFAQHSILLLYFELSAAVIFVTFFCILVLYICIGMKASDVRSRSTSDPTSPRNSHRGIKRQQTMFGRDLAGTSETAKNDRFGVSQSTSGRTTAICITVNVAFVVCFFPTFILTMVKKQLGTSLPVGNVVYGLFLRSYYMTNAINPVIYAFLNPVFRKQCSNIFREMKCGLWRKFARDRTSSDNSPGCDEHDVAKSRS